MDYMYDSLNAINYPKVRSSTIIIYLIYFGMMWPIVGLMIKKYKKIDDIKEYLISRKLGVANFLLVAGDTAMFICWMMLFVSYEWVNSIVFNKNMLSIVPLGVVTTSITMSMYYFYLYIFYKERFQNGKWTSVGYFIFFLVLIRLVLHYNPYNIWLNIDPSGSSAPNYTAWIRNIPLFMYGLLVVSLIYRASRRAKLIATDIFVANSYRKLEIAMIFLYVSFFFYGLDVFFSHIIPSSLIWITYTLKTFAYVGAAWNMLHAQFRSHV